MFRVFAAILVILFGIGGAAHAATPGTPPQILIVGDSLSAGFGIGKEQSWPALLAQIGRASCRERV